MSPRIEPNVPIEVLDQLRKDLAVERESLTPKDHSTALWASQNKDGVTVHTHGTTGELDLESALDFYKNIESVIAAQERGESFSLQDAKAVGLMHTTMEIDGRTKTVAVKSGSYILVSHLNEASSLDGAEFKRRA